MQHIKLELHRKLERDRRTERGELMKYFCSRINPSRMQEGLPKVTMSRMGKLLEKIPTKDLYYLKSVCDKAKNFSAKFWWELDPDKHGNAAEMTDRSGKRSPRASPSRSFSGGGYELDPEKHQKNKSAPGGDGRFL